jgi:hypothetical protein
LKENLLQLPPIKLDYLVSITDETGIVQHAKFATPNRREGYTRYDFSTATKLLGIAKTLKEKYSSLERLHTESSSPSDLENRLQEIKGIGPVGVNIFLRELRGIWEKAKPNPFPMAVLTAQRIGLDLEDVERYESQLVRLNLEYCKKHRSSECPLGNNCVDK